MPSACFQRVDKLLLASKHAEGMSLRHGVIVLGDLIQPPLEIILSSGVFVVKRRAVFILGANVECEAFHVAPRLFFMFLFLIPTTIPAAMYNHCHSNFPLSPNDRFWITYCYPTTLPNNSNGVASVISTW